MSTLQLVGREVEKGDAGIAAITLNAEVLTRSVLTDVLKLATHPKTALAALAATDHFLPTVPSIMSQLPATWRNVQHDRVLPYFGVISQAYIDMRIARDGEKHADIQTLILLRQVFIDVIGDRTPDE